MNARRGLVVACLALLGASGCVSSSIAFDVDEVRRRTRVEHLAQVADVDVDPAADDDASKLLGEPLDADAAVRVALLNNRELRATLREMGIARGDLVQAGLLPNPVVEAELLPERDTTLELRVEYDITSAVLAPVRARAAAPALEAARYHAAAEVVDLGYRVRAAFYRLQAAEQRLAIAQKTLDAVAAARDAARAIAEAGNIPELRLARQEAAYERARIMVAELELEAATDREHVTRLLGAHGADTGWRTRGPLPALPEQPPAADKLETRALRASLQLAEARQRAEGLARRAGATRTAGLLPDVSLDVHALYGNPESPVEGDGSWRFGGGVSVGLPLFDRRQGSVAALEAELGGYLERFQGMAIALRSAAREVHNRVRSAHARARHYQRVIVPAQERVTNQTLLQYNAMQIDVFALLEARREQLDVELSFVETLREYWTAAAELDALLAGRQVTADRAERKNPMGARGAATGGH